jgi:hypothetical protein
MSRRYTKRGGGAGVKAEVYEALNPEWVAETDRWRVGLVVRIPASMIRCARVQGKTVVSSRQMIAMVAVQVYARDSLENCFSR